MREQILKTQLVWTAVVYGVLFTLLITLFSQNFELTKEQLFGANAAQPQIFLN